MAIQVPAAHPVRDRRASADRRAAAVCALKIVMRATLLAIGLGVGLVGLVALKAQQTRPAGPAGVMALTAMDYIQIRQLVNRYGFALDTGSRDGYDYADLFAPDGVFDSRSRGRVQGRDQLAALARGDRKGPLHVNHYIMNHVIEPTADGAVGRQYLINISHDDNIPRSDRIRISGISLARSEEASTPWAATTRTCTRRRRRAGGSGTGRSCRPGRVPTRRPRTH
jgi:hypothetical protein